MASTFTAQKDIEKPAPGTQAGVWGQTANRNFDKIDANLARVVDLSILANQTLTQSQSAVATSDAAVINLTGAINATSVTRTLTLPAGQTGAFIIDTTEVNFGTSRIQVRSAVTDGGVVLTSATDNVVQVYSNGTSVRRVIEKAALGIPFSGEIRMYTPPGGTLVSSALPEGWHVANGNNGTVDLRGRFIYATCVNSQVNDTGGSNTVNISATFSGTTSATAITAAQMPAHTHGIFANQNNGPFTSNDPALTSRTQVVTPGAALNGSENFEDFSWQLYSNPNRDPQDPMLGSTSEEGSGQGHTHNFSGTATQNGVENRPLFYRLIFLQFTGT